MHLASPAGWLRIFLGGRLEARGVRGYVAAMATHSALYKAPFGPGGVSEVDVKLVMEPPWTPDRMTEDARDQLGIF